MTFTTADVAAYAIYAGDMHNYADAAQRIAQAATADYRRVIASTVDYTGVEAISASDVANYAVAYATAAYTAAASAAVASRHVTTAVSPADDSPLAFMKACVSQYATIARRVASSAIPDEGANPHKQQLTPETHA